MARQDSELAEAKIKKNVDQNDQEIIDQVKKLPISDEQKHDIIATMEMYSGPIPHPKILAGYQALYPNAAEKIIENGLEESRHRRQLETARQRRRGHLAWGSMLLLVLLCLLFMTGSFYLVLKNHPVIGSIFGGGSFITLVGTLTSNITELTKNDDISRTKNSKSAK
ncbi:DUF2335 domain-containing protein [Limosilactobacillus mucosae]|uniref:DUF2335 domain-containing protein n=1 Tax=Limosilactobacillus mucosae TaxID=97478 RepID=UPI0006528132|nr:DUF2335 domain-containing protein [Limosilactobacillus mucosae]HAM86069.1 DUF2335 domain-containing protein [Lactobacillus sp.]